MAVLTCFSTACPMVQILFRLESLHSSCLKTLWSGTFFLFAALSAYAVCTFYLCFVSTYSVNRTARISWKALHSFQVPQLSQSTGSTVRWDEVLENINVRAWGSEHSEDSALNPGAALAAGQTV